MRKAFALLVIVIIAMITACSHKIGPYSFTNNRVSIFINPGGHCILPSYIILKSPDSIYEKYSFVDYNTVVGKWKISGDTLIVSPKFRYGEYKNKIRLKIYTDSVKAIDSLRNVDNIDKYYLIRKNCLIDVTNYAEVWKYDTMLVNLLGTVSIDSGRYYSAKWVIKE